MTQIRYIDIKTTTKMIRAQLKAKFPAVKFSVRCDHSAVNIKWTGGPLRSQVESIVSGFDGSGFDGMTDCPYTKYSWLYPDGSTSFASNTPTAGHPELFDGPTRAGAELVQFGAKFIFCSRQGIKTECEAVAEFLNGYVTPQEAKFYVSGSDEYGWSVHHNDYNIERCYRRFLDPVANMDSIPDHAWRELARIYQLA